MDVPHANLEQFISELHGQAVNAARDRYGVMLDFSMNSVSKLLTLVEQAHQAYVTSPMKGPGLEKTIQVWGAYLGETLRRNKGGVWKIDPEQTGDRKIYLATGSGRIFPFEQIRERITGETPPPPERDMPLLPPEPEKPKSNLLIILLVAFGVFAILAAGAIFAIQLLTQQRGSELIRQKEAYEAPFVNDIGNYLKEYSNPAASDPELSGKVLVVSRNTGRIADLQYKLPREMRATSPADLGVIIQQECQVIESATNEDGAILNRISCRLTLINAALKEAGYQQDFVSNEFHPEAAPGEDPASSLDPTIMISWIDAMVE